MTQLRSLNERRKIKLNNLARHLNVRLWSFSRSKLCATCLFRISFNIQQKSMDYPLVKMSMDPCEEFRVHVAKNMVRLRLFARVSQIQNFENPAS